MKSERIRLKLEKGDKIRMWCTDCMELRKMEVRNGETICTKCNATYDNGCLDTLLTTMVRIVQKFDKDGRVLIYEKIKPTGVQRVSAEKEGNVRGYGKAARRKDRPLGRGKAL